MKATVTIAFPIMGSRSMYDSQLNNGEIIRTSKKGAVLIEGDHAELGRATIWVAPGMIYKEIRTARNTTYLLYSILKGVLKFKQVTNQ